MMSVAELSPSPRRLAGELVEIVGAVTPGAHALIILDKAGWHTTRKLKLPSNLTLVPLRRRLNAGLLPLLLFQEGSSD